MLSGNVLPWIPAVSLMLYTPYLSYLDYRYRDIRTHKIWLPLILVNVPVLIAAYVLGIYNWNLGIISLACVAAWFALMRLNLLPGADFMFLALISLFMVLNPMSGWPFMPWFTVNLVVFTAAAFWYVLLDNVIVRKVGFSLKAERGIPFLIPISLALITAVVMG